MTPEHVLQLQTDFPYFERFFGIECGDGWFQTIYDLCLKIRDMNPPDDFQFVQVKEKFGALRAYADNGTEPIYAAIHEAEALTTEICEECGKPGKFRTVGYWMYTSCDEHTRSREQK